MPGDISKTEFFAFCWDFLDSSRQGEEYLRAHDERLWKIFDICRANVGDGAKVISVGAGSAYIEHALHHFTHADVTVVDFPEAIECHREHYARSNFRTIGCDLSVSLVCDDLYDLALSSSVVQHIPRSPYEHIRMLSDVLDSNGKFVLNTPNFANIRNVFRLLMMQPIIQAPEKTFGEVSYENEAIQRREYVPIEIHDAIRRCGLDVVKTYYSENGSLQSFKDYVFHGMSLPGLDRFRLSMTVLAEKRM